MPIAQPDVIYLDPMYPVCKKQVLPKKNIQFLRKLIGINNDAQYLLHIAKNLAKQRIVIKRPYHAKSISNEKADFIIASKNHRFDIYYPYKK
jgi:16S rRNA (guanine1516-N2)-methyltransferase